MQAASSPASKSLKRGYVIANFGGPRSLEEVEPFLKELLSDQDVLRTPLPAFLHRLLFRWVAHFRAPRIREEYRHMKGRSPIFEDTEQLATCFRDHFKAPVITFHRYLSATHAQFLESMASFSDLDEILVVPLFPQYSSATTGSLARWMQRQLPRALSDKLRWIASYCDHPLFIDAYSRELEHFFETSGWRAQQTAALCSFHGLPKSFVLQGDPYAQECERSFYALAAKHPEVHWHMSYQSKFGPGEWLKPYTQERVENPSAWTAHRQQVIVIPLAFTSDHIETLIEIEKLYLPPLRLRGLKAARLGALSDQKAWSDALAAMVSSLQEQPGATVTTQSLIPVYKSILSI